MRIHLNFCHICSVFLMLLTCLRSFLFLAPTRALPYYITLSSWYIREKETSLTYFFYLFAGVFSIWQVASHRHSRLHFSDPWRCISQIFKKKYFCISSPVASLSCISLALACSCLQCCSRFPAQLGIRWGNCICQFIDWEIDAYSHDEVAAD